MIFFDIKFLLNWIRIQYLAWNRIEALEEMNGNSERKEKDKEEGEYGQNT